MTSPRLFSFQRPFFFYSSLFEESFVHARGLRLLQSNNIYIIPILSFPFLGSNRNNGRKKVWKECEGRRGKKRDNEREISGRISRRSMTLDSWRRSPLLSLSRHIEPFFVGPISKAFLESRAAPLPFLPIFSRYRYRNNAIARWPSFPFSQSISEKYIYISLFGIRKNFFIREIKGEDRFYHPCIFTTRLQLTCTRILSR